MSIAEWFGIGKEVAEPVTAVGNALDKLFTSDDERLTKQEILDRTAQNPLLWQSSLDQLNAKSSFWLAAVARPFNVWVAGIIMLNLTGMVWYQVIKTGAIPEWFSSSAVTSFLGALGIYGIARTVEKIGKVK